MGTSEEMPSLIIDQHILSHLVYCGSIGPKTQIEAFQMEYAIKPLIAIHIKPLQVGLHCQAVAGQ